MGHRFVETAEPDDDEPPRHGRGRDADSPAELPALGWRDVLLRTWQQIGEDQVGLVAAGVAFYAMLAVFPALAALVSVYGWIADPSDVETQLLGLGPLPGPMRELLGEELRSIARRTDASLGLAFVAGLLGALWSANRGATAIVRALNIAYEEGEERGFFRLSAICFVFTVGGIAAALVGLTLILGIPALLSEVGLGALAETALQILPWLLPLFAWWLALSLLYRFGPSRRPARWRWVTPGALVATLIWLLGSIGFSAYVANFASYDETYGSVGAVVVVLMWFYLSAWAAMLGAELNAEMEHQTRRDSTVGGDQPLGERGAFVADDVGEVP